MDDLGQFRDRIEIADVLLRYGSSLDERDWDRLETCFIPEATGILAGGPRLAGYESIVEAIRVALEPYESTHHVITNAEAELDGDSARLRANLIATHILEQGRFVVGGVYREELVRTSDGWRISHHQLDALWFEGP
ncbi:MAG: nuclear transport factor 2 family protein [Acidimicrobiia bacterium]|nr:nuclear transport factor 2 family protein [Acidimicrobiia bacterium]